MIKENLLKKRLKKGEVVFGPWCIIPSPTVINIIAAAGMDFVILDLEHGPISYETLENMVRSAEVENCCPLARVGQRDELQILRALDLGIHGVLVPHIQSKKEALECISFAKYYPDGRRGFSPYTRAGGYGINDIENYAAKANLQTLAAIILEGINGINNLDEILETPNLDLIYIGAYDLSQALGIPGQVNHPDVKKHLKKCVKKIRDRGIAAGGYVAKNAEDIKWMTDIGMQFITYLPDAAAIFETFHNISTEFKRIIQKGR